MRATDEQLEILQAVRDHSLVKVSAVAGSGKTSTLQMIAKEINPKTGLYLAFNKAIADEAATKFPHQIQCRTVHSLAHTYIVKGTKRKINSFGYDSIKEDISYEEKRIILDRFEEFCNSKYLSPYDLFPDEPKLVPEIVSHYLSEMVEGKMDCTFSFLLKYFHLLLEGNHLPIKEEDLLFLDEAGDTTGVILEIFKLYPAKKKVMVGDKEQNIYAFMNTINGFEKLKDEGVFKTLSQSFRVSAPIAELIEEFCQKYLDEDMVFKGVTHKVTEDTTKAYIARTNGALIQRMLKLNSIGESYTLIRNPSEIFSAVLSYMQIEEGKPTKDFRYKHIKREFDTYNKPENLQLRIDYPSFRSYIASILHKDKEISAICNLLNKYSKGEIYDTYYKAKGMLAPSNTYLATCHSVKGLQFDRVYIENDLNKLPKVIETEEDLTEYRLYYVACTRAKHYLDNATKLKGGEEC